MNINKIKVELEQELLKLDTVKSVFWEYPEFFTIETSWGDYHLGGVNGPIGWNNPHGSEEGETNETNPQAIAKAFAEWLTNGRA